MKVWMFLYVSHGFYESISVWYYPCLLKVAVNCLFFSLSCIFFPIAFLIISEILFDLLKKIQALRRCLYQTKK